MTQESTTEPNFAAQMMSQDRGGTRSTHNPIDFIIDQELQFERRVRRAAMFAWSLALASVPLLGIAMFIVDNGGGTLVEVARWSIVVVGGTGLLGLVAALMTTLAWLFRGRGASLAAIDRRLAALETILISAQKGS